MVCVVAKSNLPSQLLFTLPLFSFLKSHIASISYRFLFSILFLVDNVLLLNNKHLEIDTTFEFIFLD